MILAERSVEQIQKNFSILSYSEVGVFLVLS